MIQNPCRIHNQKNYKCWKFKTETENTGKTLQARLHLWDAKKSRVEDPLLVLDKRQDAGRMVEGDVLRRVNPE